jgi:hypothetical protein
MQPFDRFGVAFSYTIVIYIESEDFRKRSLIGHQRFQIGGKRFRQHRPVGKESGGSDAQHGIWAWDRPVGFDIDTEIKFRMIGHFQLQKEIY